eukprot:TRINITY_DN2399_c1_g1_i1.p1 TRINITY_DN2399_c1_g1~~TRINITY_DN2399_c1_g1_i1.p1  ORF type:complete len:86 (+),score=15.56 TRINITY_DN2399_c1_g1_i1:293-550(+)
MTQIILLDQWLLVLEMEISYCHHIAGKSSNTLSIFLGILGIDIFYMGHPTIRFVEMFSLGDFGLGWLVDFFLIVTEISTLSHGSV